ALSPVSTLVMDSLRRCLKSFLNRQNGPETTFSPASSINCVARQGKIQAFCRCSKYDLPRYQTGPTPVCFPHLIRYSFCLSFLHQITPDRTTWLLQSHHPQPKHRAFPP